MGNLGFTKNNEDYGNEMKYGIPVHPPHTKTAPDIFKWIRAIGAAIATLALLGGLVWGAAFMFAGMASDSDLDKVEDRVEQVEKNDIRQTIILEQIKKALEKIDEKLDKALKK